MSRLSRLKDANIQSSLDIFNTRRRQFKAFSENSITMKVQKEKVAQIKKTIKAIISHNIGTTTTSTTRFKVNYFQEIIKF